MSQCGPIDLRRGDCLEVMPKLRAQSVDLILADLPYGATACKWDSIIPLEALWSEYRRLLRPGGAVVLTACQPFTSKLVMSNPKWFRVEWVWEKCNSTGFLDCNRRPMRAHESVLVFAPRAPRYRPQFSEGKAYIVRRRRRVDTLRDQKAVTREYTTINLGSRFPRSVIRVNNQNGQGKVHPTQKPVELMEYFIRTYSDAGHVVLDNTMGSGTTGVAAVQTGRRFIGIERDPGYSKIARNRINAAVAAQLCEVL